MHIFFCFGPHLVTLRLLLTLHSGITPGGFGRPQWMPPSNPDWSHSGQMSSILSFQLLSTYFLNNYINRRVCVLCVCMCGCVRQELNQGLTHAETCILLFSYIYRSQIFFVFENVDTLFNFVPKGASYMWFYPVRFYMFPPLVLETIR